MAGEESQLYREVLAKIDALKDSLTSYKVIVNEKIRRAEERVGDLVARVRDLEDHDAEAEKSIVTALRTKVATFEEEKAEEEKKAEAEKKEEAKKALEVRRQTVRNAMMLCIGGIITIGVSALAHVLGLK